MMADVHFVVGPPGGTQRVPGHKVTAHTSFSNRPEIKVVIVKHQGETRELGRLWVT